MKIKETCLRLNLIILLDTADNVVQSVKGVEMAKAELERKRVIDTLDARDLLKDRVKPVIDCAEYYILKGSYDSRMRNRETGERAMV